MKESESKLAFWTLVTDAIALVIGIMLLILSRTVLKDQLIIRFGVRAIKHIYTFEFSFSVIIAIFTVWRAVRFWRLQSQNKRRQAQKHEQAKQQAKVVTDYAEDSSNPIFTRRRLQQIAQEMPDLEELIGQCLDQMDRMDKLQMKQEILIETNDARYLKDTVVVLENVESRICRNFRNVINLCIAAEDLKHLDMKKIQKSLDDNEKKLSDTQELLKASVDWINQYNTDSQNSDRSEVENWIAVIRDSLKEDER